MGFFTRVVKHSPQLTTYAQAKLGGTGLSKLRRVHHHSGSDKIAQEKLASALKQLPCSTLARLREMQSSGISDGDFYSEEVRPALLNVNRYGDNEVEHLPVKDFLSLTPHVPHPEAKAGGRWEQDQVLIHDTDELVEVADEGAQIISNGQCAMGIPAAGVASRAADIFRSREDLVGIMTYLMGYLEGLNGLSENTYPPRFLYPVASTRGIMTLLGMMLENLHIVGTELGTVIPSLLMLHPNMSEFVLAKLADHIKKWGPDWQESILLWAQSMSQRYYLTDQQPLKDLFPNGHGEHPRMLAELDMFNFLRSKGINYYFFANADEIVFGPNPILAGVAGRLIQMGYAQVVFVVDNPTNQGGGGPVRHITVPENTHLIENPSMPTSFITGGKYPRCINTLSIVGSTDKLAQVSPGLAAKTTLLLEAKVWEGRNGGVELIASAEGHAGTELTNPHGRDAGSYRNAFVYVNRPGFFMGIKTPAHVYDGSTPPELLADPIFGRMSYATYTRHMFNTFPAILRGMIERDRSVLEQIFKRGGSYLLPIDD
ncbi:MAG: hypothetical protein KKH83_03160 [Candidatus Margulisbacteria bacterium]|nr:hypothetical protein [Candidatus Margulisiibacteriota bacterium]